MAMLVPVIVPEDYKPLDPNSEEWKKESERQKEQTRKEAELTFGKDGAGFLYSAVDGFLASPIGKQIGNAFMQGINSTAKGLEAIFPSSSTGKPTTFFEDAAPSYGSTAKPIVYSDWSPASKLFGMDQGTAFSEHMANTAHQREVADLKAAGLNPVLGISGSGASSVSGNVIASSSAQKAQDVPWMDILGATAGLITTIVSKKPSLGYMVSNVFKSFD